MFKGFKANASAGREKFPGRFLRFSAKEELFNSPIYSEYAPGLMENKIPTQGHLCHLRVPVACRAGIFTSAVQIPDPEAAATPEFG